LSKAYNGEKTTSSKNVAGKTRYLHAENIRPENLMLVQERAGNTLELVVIVNNFLKRIQMGQQLREMIDKWDYMKFKGFYTQKKLSPD
jgi:hypothetical protein